MEFKKKTKEALRRGGKDSYLEASKHFWEREEGGCCRERKEKWGKRFDLSYELEKERLQVDHIRAAHEAKKYI